MRGQREVKLVLVGDTGVGKTSLVRRFVADTFAAYEEETIGAAFLTKTIVEGDTPVRFQIWDTSGRERYQSLVPMLYRNAEVAIVVYDVTRQQSLPAVQKWVRLVQQVIVGEPLIAIVGNKSDLDAKRQIRETDARAYAEEIGALFTETSARDGANVLDLFTQISRELADVSRASSLSLTSGGSDTKSMCW